MLFIVALSPITYAQLSGLQLTEAQMHGLHRIHKEYGIQFSEIVRSNQKKLNKILDAYPKVRELPPDKLLEVYGFLYQGGAVTDKALTSLARRKAEEVVEAYRLDILKGNNKYAIMDPERSLENLTIYVTRVFLGQVKSGKLGREGLESMSASGFEDFLKGSIGMEVWKDQTDFVFRNSDLDLFQTAVDK